MVLCLSCCPCDGSEEAAPLVSNLPRCFELSLGLAAVWATPPMDRSSRPEPRSSKRMAEEMAEMAEVALVLAALPVRVMVLVVVPA